MFCSVWSTALEITVALNVTSECKNKNLCLQDVYYPHFSPGIAQGVFIVMSMHSRVCSQKKCQFIIRFKDLHFPSILCTRNRPRTRGAAESQSTPTVCETVNYLLTSSVTCHLSLTMAFSSNCFLVLFVWCFYFSGSKWNRQS